MRAHNLSRREAFGGPAAALLAVVCALLALLALAWASPAKAATTFTVDRSDDPDPTTAQACTAASNDCSLRGAIVAANALAGRDVIDFSVSTVTLSRAGPLESSAATGDLDITQGVDINGGSGVDINTASGFDDRVFDGFSPASVGITGVTARGGRLSENGARAGGIQNRSGATLVLTNSTVSGNTASSPSGGFTAAGGGIGNQGTLTLTRSTVSGNTASSATTVAAGGGIWNLSGTVALNDSTVSGNTVSSSGSSASSQPQGGGIYNNGTITLTNSTVSGNTSFSTSATAYGGGILNTTANVTLTNSTVSDNEASSTNGETRGGLYTQNVATLLNTIVANNSAATQGPDVAGPFTGGNNLIEDPSGSGGSGTQIVGVDPLLGPLQNNGGPTKTHALLENSPAIDSGSNSGCPGADQRGEPRPEDGDGNGTATCDIGAFEKETAPPDATAPTVIGTTPTAGATGVPRNVHPTATFSEEMDPNTLNTSTVQLYQEQLTRVRKKKRKKKRWVWVVQQVPVNVQVSYNAATRTLTLTPSSSPLAANTKYTAVIITGAKDDANNALAQNYSWSFTTGSS